MGTESQVDSSSSAKDSVPACRSTQLSLPNDPAAVCSGCGRDGDPFHRLKHDGAVRNFCSSCILFLYKGMYCCLCFVVYETPAAKGDASLWVSCAKCQRIGHIKCARDRDLHIDSVFFTCVKCSQPKTASSKNSCSTTEGQPGNESPPLKKLRLPGDEQSECAPLDDQQSLHVPPEEALAAAQIVALLAVQQAKDAKARARASAAAAARAASCAKAALDTAYRVAQDEARWKPESSRRLSGVLPGINRGLPSLSAINVPKNMRVDGGVPMPTPISYSDSLSHKDQVGKDHNTASYGPINATISSVQFNKMKALPSSTEVTGALPRSDTVQRPQAVCVQDAVEGIQSGTSAEGVIDSASPASIMDAAASLDAPRLNLSAEPGSVPEAASTESSSSVVLTRSDLTQWQTSKDQPLSVGKKDQRVDDSVLSVVKEVATKSSSMHSCAIDVEGMEVSPHFSGKDKAAVDGLVGVSRHAEQK